MTLTEAIKRLDFLYHQRSQVEITTGAGEEIEPKAKKEILRFDLLITQTGDEIQRLETLRRQKEAEVAQEPKVSSQLN